MKRKAIIPLVLGLAIGVITVKFLVDAIQNAQASNKATTTISVVLAKQDIGAFEAITPEMVEVVQTSDSLLAPANDRIEKVEYLEGRVAGKAIPERAAVLKSMLAEKGTKAGLTGRIPPGYRAVSVKIDEVSGVAYQLKPGDWVDVYVVMDVASPYQKRKETVAEVILQHVQVAAIGYATNAQESGTSSKVKPAKSATLLVLEEDVPKLHLAATRGKVTLAMRGDDGAITAHPASADMGDVLAGRSSRRIGERNPDKDAKPSLMEALAGVLSGPAKPTPVTPDSLVDADPELPHAVLVYRGSTLQKTPATIEQITFENAESPKILEVSPGPPSRASAMMRPPRGSSD